MVITASRRTDIPAFYSAWFMKRIEARFFENVNPFNPRQSRKISLAPGEVDVILFLSKNPGPLLPCLDRLDHIGYRYYFHFTLNDYPQVIEPRVPPVKARVDLFQRLSGRVGPEKVIWRYDPIIISNLTPVDYHLERFGRLAEKLSGQTDQVIISLLQVYEKVKARFLQLEASHGLKVVDIRAEEQRGVLQKLVSGLSKIARENGMRIVSCAELLDLREYGIEPGSCVDLERINRIFGLSLQVKRDKSQRPNCNCAQAVDMGVYDTCKFNCCYCYATRSEQAVWRKLERYNVEGEALVKG